MVMRGSGRGDLKEVSFMYVLLGGGNYRMLALLRVLLFDFYMVFYSRQLICLNNVSVIKLVLTGALQSCIIGNYLLARSIGRLGR